MRKILYFFSVFLITVMCSLPLLAQEVPVLNLKNSGSMGFVPTITKPITSNRTKDLGESDIELDDNRRLSVLGCGALDTHEARLSVLRESDDRINDYFNTPVSDYMVTTLFNSPAVAQLFNSLENFSGTRVRELQDRCAAMEYKDDLAAAQWQSVQACIDSVVAENSDDANSPEVIADAFKYCLSSPDYVTTGVDASSAGTSLQDTAKAILESRKWNGTLFSALENTRACVQTVNGKRCDLFAFIPNVRWCTLTNKADYEHCAEENEGDPETDVGSSDYIISPEAISPIQIFNAAFGTTEAFTGYAMTYAKELSKLIGYENALGYASQAENVNAKIYTENVATYDDVLSGNAALGKDEGLGVVEEPLAFDTDYGNFINCGAFFDGSVAPYGDYEWEDFNEIVKDQNLINQLPPRLEPGIIYGDYFKKSDIGSSDSTLEESGGSVTEPYDPQYASNVVDVAVKCVVADELRLGLPDYIALVRKKDSKDAALLGYRTQVAYAATRNLLRYFIHRLQLAQLDLAVVVSTDPNSPPPYVRQALSTIIASLQNRLDEIETRRQHQRDYAKMISRFHTIGNSNNNEL